MMMKLEAEIEKLRMQLAACGVAAMCNTEESKKQQRIDKNNPYYSASYQDVCDAVDREIKLREALEFAQMTMEHAIHLGYVGEGSTQGMYRDALNKIEVVLGT